MGCIQTDRESPLLQESAHVFGPAAHHRTELTRDALVALAALATGRTIREAATSLLLSPKTVDSHSRQVHAKLGIHSRAELALVATQRGWLEP